jgi:hypothetical protein
MFLKIFFYKNNFFKKIIFSKNYYFSKNYLRSATSRARAFSKSSSMVPSDIGDSIYSQGVPAPTARSSSGNSNSEKKNQILKEKSKTVEPGTK